MKNLFIQKDQSAIKIKLNIIKLRNLLKRYSLEEIKQIGFQLMDYSLDAIVDKVEEKKGKRIIEVKDTDLYY